MLWKGFQKWVLVAKAQKRLLPNSVKAWIKRLHRLTFGKLEKSCANPKAAAALRESLAKAIRGDVLPKMAHSGTSS